VIIPVYNAAKYVTKAVETALAQPETAEVIVIEDGSTDGSLEVCKNQAAKYEKVHLMRHPGGGNRGAGASRNLGLQDPKFEFIAFLDADDYYLPKRFSKAKELFASDPDCDGVYEAIGKHYENMQAQKRWQKSGMSTSELTTMRKVVDPEDLLNALLSPGFGYFSLDGLVLKQPILEKSGTMNEKLLVHQDTDFMYRLAYVGKLRPGRLDEPVTMRRIHSNNRISAPRSDNRILTDRIKMWRETFLWFRENSGNKERALIIKEITSDKKVVSRLLECLNFLPRRILFRLRIVTLLIYIPEIILEPSYWKILLPKLSIK
jgi:glycosyltransferase involved in cell wall biosynthesis